MSVVERAKSSFVAGLVLLLPLAITLFIIQFAFVRVTALVDPLVRWVGLPRYTANVELLAQLVAIGVVVLAVTVLGAVAQSRVGRTLLAGISQFVDFVPVFRTVYGSVRGVASSFAERSDTYETVVFVEYPSEGRFSIGFVTGEAPDDLAEVTGEPTYNVYLPSSPNPTAGRLVLVPERNLHESELSIRQGIRLLMTTGTATDGDDEEAVPPEIQQRFGDDPVGDGEATGDG